MKCMKMMYSNTQTAKIFKAVDDTTEFNYMNIIIKKIASKQIEKHGKNMLRVWRKEQLCIER